MERTLRGKNVSIPWVSGGYRQELNPLACHCVRRRFVALIQEINSLGLDGRLEGQAHARCALTNHLERVRQASRKGRGRCGAGQGSKVSI